MATPKTNSVIDFKNEGRDVEVKLLRSLLQDPAERTRMAHAARKLYQERFDISHTLAALGPTASHCFPCAS